MLIRYGSAYRRAVARQLLVRGEQGYEAAVGGGFSRFGALERDAVEAAGLPLFGHLIDIGFGAGRLGAALKERSGLSYLGVDVSPKLIEKAKELCARPDWRFELVERPAIPAPDGVADIVSMFSLITHIPVSESRAYIVDATRVLKKGGAVVVSFLADC